MLNLQVPMYIALYSINSIPTNPLKIENWKLEILPIGSGALGRLLYILSMSRYNLDKNYISLFGTSPRLYRTM